MLQIVQNAIKELQKARGGTRPSLYSTDPQKLSSWDAFEWYERLPNFNRIYVDSVIEKYKVLRHTSPREFPYEVLRQKAPNQSPEEWAYQCGLYKPTTIAIWNRALNKTRVISNKQNYSIVWHDSDERQESQKEYFYKDFPAYSSLIAWVFEVLAPEKINFPNRLCVVMPNVPTDEEGQPIQSELAEPIPIIIDEEKIVHYEYGKMAIWLHSYTSEGAVFKAVDRTNFYEFVENRKQQTVSERITYVHNWEFMPAFKLRGKAEDVHGEILYRSWFADAIPTLDDVIQIRSNLMMSHFKLAYPIIIEVVDDCDDCRGTGKDYNAEKEVHETCGSCNGTGRKGWHSPTGTYQVRASKGVGQDNNLPLTPPVQFAAPSSDILRYAKEFLEDCEEKAFHFFGRPKQADAGTATEVAEMRDEFQSFLIDFSNSVFDDLEFLFDCIGFMRYGEGFESPTVRRPTEFSFKTNAEITAELTEAKKNGILPLYMAKMYGDYGSTRFNTTNLAEQFTFQLKVDKYWYLSFAELRLIASEIAPVDLALHIGYSTIIARLEMQHPDFWEKDFDEREALVREQAEIAAQPILSNRTTANVADIFDNFLNSNQ